MMEVLPHSQFRWEEDFDIATKFWDVPDDGDVGYFLEVDLEYPKYLHDAHPDLPFCAEHRSAPGSKQQKLMTTLHDKEKYVMHYRALKQALKHGLILKKIHRVLKFERSAWLKPYIDFNSARRKKTKNKFKKIISYSIMLCMKKP